MARFYDASCPSCHAKFGWYGEAEDWPPCDRCGYKPRPAEVAKLAKAGTEGGCSGPAFRKARAWLQKHLPDLWQTKPEGLVIQLAELLDSVAPGGRVRNTEPLLPGV